MQKTQHETRIKVIYCYSTDNFTMRTNRLLQKLAGREKGKKCMQAVQLNIAKELQYLFVHKILEIQTLSM